MKKRKLKLYVWDDYYTDWSPGLAFAIAYRLQDAIEMVKVKNDCDYSLDMWGPHKSGKIKKGVCFEVGGGS